MIIIDESELIQRCVHHLQNLERMRYFCVRMVKVCSMVQVGESAETWRV